MYSEILKKLVIVGLNLDTGHFSIVLNENGEVPSTDKDVESLAKYHIESDPKWYNILKKTFVESENKLYLIYNVIVPRNYKPIKGKWLSMSDTDSLSLLDKMVVVEGAQI
jgi:hypothetical protein